jgi:hypothetical protein
VAHAHGNIEVVHLVVAALMWRFPITTLSTVSIALSLRELLKV